MTEPVRHTADTITDNDLDALYARIEQAEAERDRAYRERSQPAPQPEPEPYRCAHGHQWAPHTPCQECLSRADAPHAADPVIAWLAGPKGPKYAVCQQCTQAVGEPVHHTA